jgi:hypothetical protein
MHMYDCYDTNAECDEREALMVLGLSPLSNPHTRTERQMDPRLTIPFARVRNKLTSHKSAAYQVRW